MKRLVEIRDTCSPLPKESNKQRNDPFTTSKNKINQELHDIRAYIKERDELEMKTPGTKYVVELAHNCRMAIATVQQDYDVMLHEKCESCDEKLHDELLNVIKQHIDECILLERKRYGTCSSIKLKQTDPTISELPKIDDPRFQQLVLNDHKIDDLLGIVSGNIHNLSEIAKEMKNDIVVQKDQLDTLGVTVDHSNQQLDDVNLRMKKILETTRSGDKVIIDVILIILLLGLCGVIYTIVQSRWL